MLSLLEAGGQLDENAASRIGKTGYLDDEKVISRGVDEGFVTRFLWGNPALEWLAGTDRFCLNCSNVFSEI